MNNIKDIINSLNDSLENQHISFIDGVGDVYAVSEETIKNIIILLKEQEAVKPIRMKGKWTLLIKCGNCESDLTSSMKFCPKCGRSVKWE